MRKLSVLIDLQMRMFFPIEEKKMNGIDINANK